MVNTYIEIVVINISSVSREECDTEYKRLKRRLFNDASSLNTFRENDHVSVNINDNKMFNIERTSLAIFNKLPIAHVLMLNK